MTDLLALGADVDWPDSETAQRVRQRLARRSGLGTLAGTAEWLAGVRPGGVPAERVVLVVVGDAPLDPLVEQAAADAGVRVHLVRTEAVPAAPAPTGDENENDDDQKDDDDEDDAGPPSAVELALAHGARLADELVDSGTDLVLVATASLPEADLAARVIIAVISGSEPIAVLRRGVAATDPGAWIARAVEVRELRRTAIRQRNEPTRLLEVLDAREAALVAGLALRCAVRRTPVLLDGTAALAGASTAYEAQPRAVRWWQLADLGEDPAATLAAGRLGMRAVLGTGHDTGTGLAALMCLPVLRAASRLGADDDGTMAG